MGWLPCMYTILVINITCFYGCVNFVSKHTTLYISSHMHAILHTELCWCSLRPKLRLIGTTDFRLCVTVGKRVCNQLAHLNYVYSYAIRSLLTKRVLLY